MGPTWPGGRFGIDLRHLHSRRGHYRPSRTDDLPCRRAHRCDLRIPRPSTSFPASYFLLGDSGSLFIGFLLSALAMGAGQSDYRANRWRRCSYIFAFGLPILDITLAIMRRSLRGYPLFSRRHRSHSPQVLLLPRAFASSRSHGVKCGHRGLRVCESRDPAGRKLLRFRFSSQYCSASASECSVCDTPEFTQLWKPTARRRRIETEECQSLAARPKPCEYEFRFSKHVPGIAGVVAADRLRRAQAQKPWARRIPLIVTISRRCTTTGKAMVP